MQALFQSAQHIYENPEPLTNGSGSGSGRPKTCGSCESGSGAGSGSPTLSATVRRENISLQNISNTEILLLKTHRLKMHIRPVLLGLKGCFLSFKHVRIPLVGSLIWPRAKLTLAVLAATFSCRVRYCPSTLQLVVWNTKGPKISFLVRYLTQDSTTVWHVF